MNITPCQCFSPGFKIPWAEKSDIGVTDRDWELSKLRCGKCSTPWLRAFLEYEAFSCSGRYYRAPTSDSALETITPDAALRIIKDATFRIAGGSRFDGVEHVIHGPGELLETP
ncbi:hypothetical protein [Imbroritus primus]|uniref:hypothetical protein n=1 Tax=Imbroritus primus TaxID=3058603 RepID=UPI003D1622A1